MHFFDIFDCIAESEVFKEELHIFDCMSFNSFSSCILCIGGKFSFIFFDRKCGVERYFILFCGAFLLRFIKKKVIKR